MESAFGQDFPGHKNVKAARLRERLGVKAIAINSAPPDLTVTVLARALPHRWTEQEHKLDLRWQLFSAAGYPLATAEVCH
jgi:hypothetical protein